MADILLSLANMAAKGNPYIKYTYMDIVELKLAEDFGDYYLSQDFSFTYSKDPITYAAVLENNSTWVTQVLNDRFDPTWGAELYFSGRPTTWFSFYTPGNLNLYTRSDPYGVIFEKTDSKERSSLP